METKKPLYDIFLYVFIYKSYFYGLKVFMNSPKVFLLLLRVTKVDSCLLLHKNYRFNIQVPRDSGWSHENGSKQKIHMLMKMTKENS